MVELVSPSRVWSRQQEPAKENEWQVGDKKLRGSKERNRVGVKISNEKNFAKNWILNAEDFS